MVRKNTYGTVFLYIYVDDVCCIGKQKAINKPTNASGFLRKRLAGRAVHHVSPAVFVRVTGAVVTALISIKPHSRIKETVQNINYEVANNHNHTNKKCKPHHSSVIKLNCRRCTPRTNTGIRKNCFGNHCP